MNLFSSSSSSSAAAAAAAAAAPAAAACFFSLSLNLFWWFFSLAFLLPCLWNESYHFPFFCESVSIARWIGSRLVFAAPSQRLHSFVCMFAILCNFGSEIFLCNSNNNEDQIAWDMHEEKSPEFFAFLVSRHVLYVYVHIVKASLDSI